VRPLLLLLVFLPAPVAWSAPAATVEGMRVPAWAERQGALVPLVPGLELEAGDRVRTGPGGRALLRLAEGSRVRLGAEARFRLERLDPPAEPGGPFAGVMRVARGAFRFTTTLLSRPHRRDLDIHVAAVTAGIRGTDVWGKAAADRDIVCLIDGRVTVSRGDDPPVTMDRPLSFYVAPKDAPPKPVSPVDPEQLERWAAEVDLTPGGGVVSGGPWAVALHSFRDPRRAARALEALHAAGVPARAVAVEVDGTPWRRLAVTGIADRAEARAVARRLREVADVSGAWVYRP
jgi:hypothetical protein